MSHKNVLKIEGTEAKIESGVELETSYFHNEYEQAFYSVQRIIRQNLKRKTEYQYNKIHNIIPFIGKRGTGKTSVMMSFSAMLEQYNRRFSGESKYYRFENIEEIEPRIRFCCLDCIDGSLLEKGEDIFKLILAQMYGKFNDMDQIGRPREKNYEYEKRELYQLFDIVFRSICEMEKENLKDIYYEESSITSLKNLSSSLELAKKFEKLVYKYLQLFGKAENISERHFDYTDTFLVIMVDDLDLNIPGGYEMLEKIHRYMMVKNVIVMVSVDYEQIKLLCENQLYSMVPKFDTKLNEKRTYIEGVARDFLDKIFPGNVRIYMPVFDKYSDVQIEDNENGYTKNPKDVLFKLLYNRLGMRLDIEGTKRHFYEQNSLRTFVSFYLMLKSMKSIVHITKEEKKERFFQNYKYLIFDTLNRMADERMDSKHKNIFDRIVKSDLLHSLRNFYIEVLNSKETKESILKNQEWENEKQHLRELADDIKDAEYSYGELLRIIYCWGRINNESKEMIRCLLAYYSLEFLKEYNRIVWIDNEVDDLIKEENRKQFINIVNGSVVGSWANRIMPEVYRQAPSDSQTAGMRMNLDMRDIFKMKVRSPKEGINKKHRKVILSLIRSILIQGMFFEQPSYKRNEAERWRIEREEPGTNKQQFTEEKESDVVISGIKNEDNNEQELSDKEKDLIKLNGYGIANFNIFGFISNALQYKERIYPLIKDVCNIFYKEKTEIRQVLEIFNKEFEEWEKYSKGFAIPIYNMDVTYNLIKRVRQRNTGKGKKIHFEDFWKELIKIYKFIYEHLKANDDYYIKSGINIVSIDNYNNGDEISFAEAFIKCPYIKWIFFTVDNKESGLLPDNYEKNLLGEIERVFKSSIGSREATVEYQSYDD